MAMTARSTGLLMSDTGGIGLEPEDLAACRVDGIELAGKVELLKVVQDRVADLAGIL